MRTSIMLVSVVGMGYVGIPVAVRLAQSGANVIGIDIDEDKVEKINHGIYPIDGEEPGIRELLAKFADSGNLRATSDYSDASESDAWLICVQTPFIVEDFEPNLSALKGALSCIGEVMRRGTLVVVESTIPPGTMEEVALPILESSSGLNPGSEFSLGHCPERVMPGKLLHNLANYDRALGGLDDRSHEMMLSVYRRISTGKLNLVCLKTAEVVKTFENAYRDAEIAIANDFALYCDAVGVDFFEGPYQDADSVDNPLTEVFYDAVQSPARKLFPQASPSTPSPTKEPKMRGKTWGDRLNAASAAPAPEPAPAPAPPPARPKPPPPPPKPAAAASGDPALAKYEKMIAMKLPQGAVEQKMRADGVDPSLLFPDAAPAPAKLVLPKPRKKTVHLKLHAGGDLMAQLKAGTKLKKVEVSAPLGPPPPKAMSSGDGGIGGLAEAIAASQKRRAKALANLP